MGHSQGNTGDWGLRAPMSWTADGGFSTVAPFRAPAENLREYNAADQQATPDSLWHFYQRMIAARKAHPALRLGDLTLLSSSQILAYRRQSTEETVLVAINYDNHPATVTLAAATRSATLIPINGFGTKTEKTDPQGQLELQMAPNEVRLYRVTR